MKKHIFNTSEQESSKSCLICLEIGCGSGFLLEVAIKKGWKNVTGVEPSLEAINHANKSVKSKIIHSTFESKDFEKKVSLNFRNILLITRGFRISFFGCTLVILW